MSREVRCKRDRSHSRLDRASSSCSVCSSKLEASCSKCGEFKSYAHIKAHEGKCTAPEPSEPPKTLTFAYWASTWAFGEEGFLVPPKGQFWDGLPEGCSKRHGFRVCKVKDPSLKGMEWMDSYDALFAKIGTDPHFKLAKVYHNWLDIEGLVKTPKLLKGIDVLVIGNWVHRVAMKQNSTDILLMWLERFRNLEAESGCRIFPPLDYSSFFARKELLPSLIERTVRAPMRSTPTLCIVGSRDTWKERVFSFAKENGAEKLVFKRSISGMKQHVRFVDLTDLDSFRLEDDPEDGSLVSSRERGRSSSDSAQPNLLAWTVQPFVKEFVEHDELRLYIVDGKFLWGLATNFKDGEGIALFPFAEGRRGSNWSEDAVHAAERLVAAIAVHHAHAARFLRIDMIPSNDGGWCVNELEFFGDAFLHLEVMDDAYELFPTLVECVKKWMST